MDGELWETSREDWLKLCPELHICNEAFQCSVATKRERSGRQREVKGELAACAQRLEEDGVFCLQEETVMEEDLVDVLRRGAEVLEGKGWPATFLILFDETWAALEAIRPVIEATGGPKNRCNGDILAWLIDPSTGAAGFSPHRDRQPERIADSFHKDGKPKYMTCWIALSDATPENSCLYVLPRGADPGYLDGDDNSEGLDPLQRAFRCKESYQNIRALPLKSGGTTVFTHRIIHWGSRGRRGAPPRISLSFAFSSDDFEPSYFDTEELPYPPFQLRLALATAQMIAYYDRFLPSARLFSGCQATFKELGTKVLHKSYQDKVQKEIYSAAKIYGDDEELVEELMDDMLDAEGIEDDFDDCVADEGNDAEFDEESESDDDVENDPPPDFDALRDAIAKRQKRC